MGGAASPGGIAVVHLVWVPLGVKPFADFVASYRKNPGGVSHRLIVVFNGVGQPAELEPFHAILEGVEHDRVETPSPTQDIPAYMFAARRLPFEFMCFVNSYGVILDREWLAKLHAHASRPSVGLVGATGSWESRYTASVVARQPFPRAPHPRDLAEWMLREARRRRRMVAVRRRFSPFPNPHVRSNTFMVRRDLLLGLKVGPIIEKVHAEQFESGRSGMTRQVQARGLEVLVVGRDGVGYPPAAWPQSRTFRMGRQENLLVSDNRTRQYAEADVQTQALLTRMAWGVV